MAARNPIAFCRDQNVRRLLVFVYNLTLKYSHFAFHFFDLSCRNAVNVAIPNRKVSIFTHLDGTDAAF